MLRPYDTRPTPLPAPRPQPSIRPPAEIEALHAEVLANARAQAAALEQLVAMVAEIRRLVEQGYG